MTLTQSPNVTSLFRPRRWIELRHDLEERRLARAEQRRLERELASFSTPAEVGDLLAASRNSDDADAEQVRDILSRNLLRRAS